MIDGNEKLREMAGAVPVAFTAKLSEIAGAAANVALSPACVAVIEQVPAATKVAVQVLPELATVHTEEVVEAKLTGNFEPAVEVAVSVNGVPTTCVPGLLNVID